MPDAQLSARLLAAFRGEAEERLDVLAASLLELNGAPEAARGQALAETAFREMHTLKGGARSVGLRDVERVCQAAEALLSTVTRAGAVPAGAMLAGLEDAVDALGRLMAGEAPAVPIGELVARLERDASDPESAAATSRPVPRAAPAPRVGGMLRLAPGKLDALLRQGEDLLAVKLAADEEVAAAEALVAEVRASRDLRSVEASARSLLGRLQRDRRATAAAVDGILDETRRVRMMPASSVLDLFPRMVRDLARNEGKDVEWSAAGGELEVDRQVLEAIKDPLIHLVRNAVDHGIEPPEVRETAGKSPRGQVAVRVGSLEGGRIEIEVEDDGRGIDHARVREAAIRARLLGPDEAAPLTDRAAFELIFRSGLSTSFTITDISGHGLGLAIVREHVDRLGGEISVDSAPGSGTTVRLVVPATIATFRGLLVRAGRQRVLIPIEAVERVVAVPEGECDTPPGREVIRSEGQALAAVGLARVLGIERAPDEPPRTCAIVSAGSERVGLLVDETLGETEVLVKPFAPPLVRVRHVAGAGLLGAGELVLILRPGDLVTAARRQRPATPLDAAGPAPAGGPPLVLVVDDALTTRAMERSLLELAGYRVEVAVDGLDAMRALKNGDFDLVVSDVDMPRLGGLELTASIRADPDLADLPVVLVSALASREDIERGAAAGANAYIVKSSFEEANLLEIIRRLGVEPGPRGPA